MNQHLEELSSLHALGSLAPEELNELEHLLSSSEGEAAIGGMTELHAAAATLAGLPPLNPPSAVRDALFADLDEKAHGDFTAVRNDESSWRRFSVPGAWSRELSTDNGRVTFLLRLDPSTRFPHHNHSGPEDCYVVAGDLEVDGVSYGAGDFLHGSAGSGHGRIFSRGGCTLLLTIARKDYSL